MKIMPLFGPNQWHTTPVIFSISEHNGSHWPLGWGAPKYWRREIHKMARKQRISSDHSRILYAIVVKPKGK